MSDLGVYDSVDDRIHGRSRLVVWYLTCHRIFLVPYIREAGFGGPLEMRAFDYDMSLVSTLDVAYHLGPRADGDPINRCVRNFDQWCRDLVDGPGFSWRTSPSRRGEELHWGEDDLVEAAIPVDPAGRRTPRCVAAICPLLHYDDDRMSLVPRQDQQHCFSEMALVHREQARQFGDERLLTACDLVILPEIPQLLSTRQRPSALSPCVSVRCPSLNGLGQISRDTHTRRMLDFRNELDRVGFDDFMWTPYMSPKWRDIEPGWVNEAGEIETWLATVPIVLFMYVRFHHMDCVKRQFGSEQPIPLDSRISHRVGSHRNTAPFQSLPPCPNNHGLLLGNPHFAIGRLKVIALLDGTLENRNRDGRIGLHHWQNDGGHEAAVQLRVVSRHRGSNTSVGASKLPNLPATATSLLRRVIDLSETQSELRIGITYQ
ncbi:hypothetical protein PIB30_072319 [Stylosanthes scabra]|uniref:Uncharacterized protein n=1 Tax=Stylosanthes scabra TaxID=79078 RepID=A0ABU6RP12_9FABA|nr:hypothetical protein [Stylosanthes scabra]